MKSRHRLLTLAGAIMALAWTGHAMGQAADVQAMTPALPLSWVQPYAPHDITADVTVTDAQLLNADKDQNNWLAA